MARFRRAYIYTNPPSSSRPPHHHPSFIRGIPSRDDGCAHRSVEIVGYEKRSVGYEKSSVGYERRFVGYEKRFDGYEERFDE